MSKNIEEAYDSDMQKNNLDVDEEKTPGMVFRDEGEDFLLEILHDFTPHLEYGLNYLLHWVERKLEYKIQDMSRRKKIRI